MREADCNQILIFCFFFLILKLKNFRVFFNLEEEEEEEFPIGFFFCFTPFGLTQNNT